MSAAAEHPLEEPLDDSRRRARGHLRRQGRPQAGLAGETGEAGEAGARDPFTGYFVSVAIALLVSGWLGGLLQHLISQLAGSPMDPAWRVNFGAGIFLGISFANPVGVAAVGLPARRAALRFSIGFVVGLLTQVALFTPIAGVRMSTYLFLLLAAMVVPLVVTTERMRRYMAGRGAEPGRVARDRLSRLLGLPDRVLFIGLMGLSFAAFMGLAQGLAQVSLGLGAILVAVSATVAAAGTGQPDRRPALAQELQVWFELDDEDESDPEPVAPGARARDIASRLLPGAVLFGGVLRLSVEALRLVYPALASELAVQASPLKAAAVIGASGLGFVFFGMLAALGFGLMFLRLLGRFGRWSPARLREAELALVRLMYLRPMNRG